MAMAFPLWFDSGGRTAGADDDTLIRQMLEQLLFTAQGERVNRPDFGTNLIQLVFAPNGSELGTATQLLVQGTLQRWLGDRIAVDAVNVTASDGVLSVNVNYRTRPVGQPAVATFSQDLPS